MSVARILLKQGDTVYRFLKFQATPDGSLLVFLDRDAVPGAKFSIHTTGEVHRYAGGRRQSTIFIEPLHALTKLSSIGFSSIPRISRLDKFDANKHHQDTIAILDFPEGVSERVTFFLEVAPRPSPALETFGISLNYELYSAIIRLGTSPGLSAAMADHFAHGMPSSGEFEKRQIDKASAELAFHQRIHGRGLIVFREASGAYVLLTMQPMFRPPGLKMAFNRDGLSIESIPFEQGPDPKHKVRFLICDKGGRNRKDDLRGHIASIELSAEL